MTQEAFSLVKGNTVHHPKYGKGTFERPLTNTLNRCMCVFPHNKKKGALETVTSVPVSELLFPATTEEFTQFHALEFFTNLEDSPKASYLGSTFGLTFVELLRKYEHTMYAKVRYSEKFFAKYRLATGEELTFDCPRLLDSKQVNKYGDEMIINFKLDGFVPEFPPEAHPRVYDERKGVLNDNEYIWGLIKYHGFRFTGGSTSE